MIAASEESIVERAPSLAIREVNVSVSAQQSGWPACIFKLYLDLPAEFDDTSWRNLKELRRRKRIAVQELIDL